MFLRKSLFGVLGGILVASSIAAAQGPANPPQEDTLRKNRIERLERHRERMGRREGRLGERGFARGRFLRELNLSDEQRQQQRAIVERRLESTKAQREELFRLREKRIAGTFSAEDEARANALHQEIRAAMQGMRTEIESVLTAEQKVRLEELQKERKARMEQRMQERQQRLQERLNKKLQQL